MTIMSLVSGPDCPMYGDVMMHNVFCCVQHDRANGVPTHGTLLSADGSDDDGVLYCTAGPGWYSLQLGLAGTHCSWAPAGTHGCWPLAGTHGSQILPPKVKGQQVPCLHQQHLWPCLHPAVRMKQCCLRVSVQHNDTSNSNVNRALTI